MPPKTDTYHVAIVGGGPVGLFLGICLENAGISSIILEKRNNVRSGSRSLGIHPISLELFKKQGISNSFTETGIKINRGHAFTNSRKLGSISFEDCPPPFNYVLALPQQRTETLLEEELNKLNPDLLVRGAEVKTISQHTDRVNIEYLQRDTSHNISASYLIGCDGKNSLIRDLADISLEGHAYPDTYIMGDFSDNTDLGSDAAIYLCDEGLIESFPLLDQRRRWVVKTNKYFSSTKREDIEMRINHRIGHDLSATENVMISSFGVQRLVAKPMVQHRIILAGDAAHVVSPIGGQGMNLGWLGAWDLSKSLSKIFTDEKSTAKVLNGFEKRREKAAQNAIRRAEMNMRLGRSYSFPAIRNGLVSLMLNTPLSRLMANIFTMRGVEKWVI